MLVKLYIVDSVHSRMKTRSGVKYIDIGYNKVLQVI
jgi:hypothetical protein